MANKTRINKRDVTGFGDNYISHITLSVEAVPAITRMSWEELEHMSRRGLTEREAVEMEREIQAQILESTARMFLGDTPRVRFDPARDVPGLTLAGVMSLYDHFMAQPATIIEIWFVDRPHEFWATYEYDLRTRSMPVQGRWHDMPSLAGIPLYEWYSTRHNANERRPPFADEPGVYIVLSNGEYRRISE